MQVTSHERARQLRASTRAADVQSKSSYNASRRQGHGMLAGRLPQWPHYCAAAEQAAELVDACDSTRKQVIRRKSTSHAADERGSERRAEVAGLSGGGPEKLHGIGHVHKAHCAGSHCFSECYRGGGETVAQRRRDDDATTRGGSSKSAASQATRSRLIISGLVQTRVWIERRQAHQQTHVSPMCDEVAASWRPGTERRFPLDHS